MSRSPVGGFRARGMSVPGGRRRLFEQPARLFTFRYGGQARGAPMISQKRFRDLESYWLLLMCFVNSAYNYRVESIKGHDG
jgi:hypothetical protein